ncbi:MAG: transposase [Hyphomicrobiales bacterium]|nr:transposase [Hyphomicrobiales bacterium]
MITRCRSILRRPGVWPITAAAIKALVPDVAGFTSTHHFAAWIGLAPKPLSSGGRVRKGASGPKWLVGVLARRPAKVVAVALANTMALIIIALLTKSVDHRKPESTTAIQPIRAA